MINNKYIEKGTELKATTTFLDLEEGKTYVITKVSINTIYYIEKGKRRKYNNYCTPGELDTYFILSKITNWKERLK